MRLAVDVCEVDGVDKFLVHKMVMPTRAEATELRDAADHIHRSGLDSAFGVERERPDAAAILFLLLLLSLLVGMVGVFVARRTRAPHSDIYGYVLRRGDALNDQVGPNQFHIFELVGSDLVVKRQGSFKIRIEAEPLYFQVKGLRNVVVNPNAPAPNSTLHHVGNGQRFTTDPTVLAFLPGIAILANCRFWDDSGLRFEAESCTEVLIHVWLLRPGPIVTMNGPP